MGNSSKQAPVNTRQVIRTVWALHDRAGAHDTWPTAEKIAQHLRATVEEVKPLLRQLKTNRVLTMRKRRGVEQWIPWDEA